MFILYQCCLILEYLLVQNMAVLSTAIANTTGTQGKSILQVPDTGTRVLDNTRPFLRSSIVSFWITPAGSKECKYHIFRQYWYTKNVLVFTNNGRFQYLGREVYFFRTQICSSIVEIRHSSIWEFKYTFSSNNMYLRQYLTALFVQPAVRLQLEKIEEGGIISLLFSVYNHVFFL